MDGWDGIDGWLRAPYLLKNIIIYQRFHLRAKPGSGVLQPSTSLEKRKSRRERRRRVTMLLATGPCASQLPPLIWHLMQVFWIDLPLHTFELYNALNLIFYEIRPLQGSLFFVICTAISTVRCYKTHCQDECRSLSEGVPKNLTLHWMTKYFSLLLGSIWLKKCFIQKSTLKLGFFLDMVLDQLTSEAAGTHNFKDIANFHRCFEKSGT